MQVKLIVLQTSTGQIITGSKFVANKTFLLVSQNTWKPNIFYELEENYLTLLSYWMLSMAFTQIANCPVKTWKSDNCFYLTVKWTFSKSGKPARKFEAKVKKKSTCCQGTLLADLYILAEQFEWHLQIRHLMYLQVLQNLG